MDSWTLFASTCEMNINFVWQIRPTGSAKQKNKKNSDRELKNKWRREKKRESMQISCYDLEFSLFLLVFYWAPPTLASSSRFTPRNIATKPPSAMAAIMNLLFKWIAIASGFDMQINRNAWHLMFFFFSAEVGK